MSRVFRNYTLQSIIQAVMQILDLLGDFRLISALDIANFEQVLVVIQLAIYEHCNSIQLSFRLTHAILLSIL